MDRLAGRLLGVGGVETLKDTYGAHPFGTAEAVDIHTALRSYTAWNARQLFFESRIGSREAGKEADIAVWDRDLYAMPARQLRDLKCVMTLFGGVWCTTRGACNDAILARWREKKNAR